VRKISLTLLHSVARTCYSDNMELEKMMEIKNSTFISVRVNPELHKKFHEKARRFGRSSDVLREILEAFVDGRLVISKPNGKESLYVSGSQN